MKAFLISQKKATIFWQSLIFGRVISEGKSLIFVISRLACHPKTSGYESLMRRPFLTFLEVI
jgi:hypothetical protein